MQSVYDDFLATSYAAYRADAICHDVILQLTAYPNNGRRGLLLTQAAQQDVGRHAAWHNLE